MYEDVDPELADMLGDFDPTPPPTDPDISKFFERIDSEIACGGSFSDPNEEAFARAHSPAAILNLCKLANPAYRFGTPLRKAAPIEFEDFFGAGAEPEPIHKVIIDRDVRLEDVETCCHALNKINNLVELAKRSGVPPPSGSIANQIKKLTQRMSTFLSSEQIADVEKALASLDFSCCLAIVNSALEAA